MPHIADVGAGQMNAGRRAVGQYGNFTVNMQLNRHMAAPVGRGAMYFYAVSPGLQGFDQIRQGLTVAILQTEV